MGDNFSKNVAILLNDGDGTFRAKVKYGVKGWPNMIQGADFDGSGVVDLVIACEGENTISVLFNLGNEVGCCFGITGNVDASTDETANVADLTSLVNYLFTGGPPPLCPEEADINGDTSMNTADITYLVDFLFRNGPPPANCP